MTAPKPPGSRIPPAWGRSLEETDYATLADSWITREIADAAMLRRVDEQEGREVVGQKGSRDCAGILFPYYWPGDPRPFSYRLRRDNPEFIVGKDGKPKPDRKYLGPPKSANRLYFPPAVAPEQLQEVTTPIIFVEGEKKALALERLAYHETQRPRFVPIAMPGVWNWLGVVGKTGGPRGERVNVKGPITDLGRIRCDERTVFILFDTNVHTNESVQAARRSLARHLAGSGAKVKFVNLPEDCGVNGVDDLLGAWGPARVLELIHQATDGAVVQVIPSPQFESRPTGMFRVTQQGEQLRQTQLTNYQASIKTNVLLDDGLDVRREFEIEAALLGRHFRFTVPASEFAAMNWALAQMGPGAIMFPNQREYARAAIQWFSMAAEERCVYTHTGWRKVDGQWLFLHAGGAIGNVGTVSEVNVRLLGSMGRYELRPPLGPEGLKAAVKASLRLVELGPPSISFPLLAATYRAVFGDTDFSIHLAGETGAFKSELAALHQQHFGADMDRLHLPGAWSSTGNALEVMAFSAKDALFVIDDFAPQGSVQDIARYHAAADRVFRAAGNHAGRGRLDSTARLRDAKPPRSLILSTGEDIPRGHSVRARLLILEVAKGSINTDGLSACQLDALAGLYAEAMGGFVRWIAGRHDKVRAVFDARVTELRGKALTSLAHARTPDIVASLQAGFESFLDFSLECGLIGDLEHENLATGCWEALREVALAQADHHAATEPTARFLGLLRASLTSGRAHLEGRDGGMPDKPAACGWRFSNGSNWSPLGDCVGWVDGEDLLLESTAAYRVVQMAARDTAEPFSISEQMLKKRLHEKGLLASTDQRRQTLTVRRTLVGSNRAVLHLLRSTLLPESPEEDPANLAAVDEGEFVG